MRRLVWMAGLLAVAAPLSAQEPADGGQRHDVRRGDTLWDLAAQYLGTPYRWPELYELNRDIVRDPHWIYPREMLRIPGYNYPAGPSPEPRRTVFFREEAASAADGALREARVEAAPVLRPGDFQRAGLLLPEAEVVPLGRLEELRDPSAVPMGQEAQPAPYGVVYLTVARPGSVRPGDVLQLLRRGRRLEPYGRIFESTGTVVVSGVEGGVATARIRDMYASIAVGDLAVAALPSPVPAGVSPRPVPGREGVLLGFETPHVLQSEQERAFVDLGREAGLAEGDELLAYLPPETRPWGVRPEIRVARLQVIRTTARTSAVRVVHLDHPALAAGLRVRVVETMP